MEGSPNDLTKRYGVGVPDIISISTTMERPFHPSQSPISRPLSFFVASNLAQHSLIHQYLIEYRQMASSSAKRPAETSPKAPAPPTKCHQANSSPAAHATPPHTAREQVMWLKDPAPVREHGFANAAAIRLFPEVKVYHCSQSLLIY